MDDHYTPVISDEERAARRAARAEARRKKVHARRMRRLRQALPVGCICLVLVVALSAWAGSHHQEEDVSGMPTLATSVLSAEPIGPQPLPKPQPLSMKRTDSTVQMGEELPSKHAVVIDLQSGTILAEKAPDTVISPASMTKILTLLVASEHLTEEDLDKTFTMSREITDYCYVNDCSVVGLMVDETVPVRELLYGTILPSGADAAMGLAHYVAGSHEAFVELMNEKLDELGLSDTAHFTNCVGLYDENHHCTVKDMAVILEAALENDLCREVLKSRTYETAPTPAHPDGQVLSNWFLRRIEDKDTGDITVIGAKTGYVVQSGNCAASAGEDAAGNRYIVVTADSYSSWGAIYDHVDLYSRFCNP